MNQKEEEDEGVGVAESYVDSLDAAREDALFSFEEHIRSFEEEAAKGGRIAQLDGLILTVFVSIITASDGEVLTFINEPIVIGLGFLVIGFLLGMVGQFSMDVSVGVSEIGIEGILEQKSGEIEYKEWSLRHYKKWISDANEKAERRARIVKGSAIASVFGLLFLLSGMFLTVLG